MSFLPQLNLQQVIVDAFSNNDEISRIYSFGSMSVQKGDKYSDIDLTVLSVDINKTTEKFVDILDRTKKLNSVFTLFENDESAAYTIFFKNTSPFHKLDIGFCPAHKPELFNPHKLVYKAKVKKASVPTKVISRKESDLDHKVLDCLIGSIRYLKHINRNEPWVAYKFYRAFIEQYLLVKTKAKFYQFDFNAYKTINNKLGQENLDLIFVSSLNDMNNSYFHYLTEYFSFTKKKLSKETRNFASNILDFWASELDNFSK